MSARQLVHIRTTMAFFAWALLAQAATAAAGTRPLELQDLMQLRTIREVVISDDGTWVAYALWPDRGDGEAVARSVDGDTEHRIPRGSAPVISGDSRWVAAVVEPTLEKIEESRDEDEEDQPKPGLALLDTDDGSLVSFDRVERFAFSKDGRWLVYQHFKEKKERAEEKKEPAGAPADEEHLGSTLVLRQLASGTEVRLAHVSGFALAEPGGHLAYAVAAPGGKGNGLFVRLLQGEQTAALTVHEQQHGRYTALAWPEKAPGQLAFVAAVDEDGEPGDADLWLWDPPSRGSRALATSADAPEGWFIPSVNELAWSRDQARLFFGYKPDDEKLEEADEADVAFDPYDLDSILAGRGVDVWHWNDPLIVPNQKKLWEHDPQPHGWPRGVFRQRGPRLPAAGSRLRCGRLDRERPSGSDLRQVRRLVLSQRRWSAAVPDRGPGPP